MSGFLSKAGGGEGEQGAIRRFILSGRIGTGGTGTRNDLLIDCHTNWVAGVVIEEMYRKEGCRLWRRTENR